MTRICTICARGGSKGVPGKNLAPLLGRSLIAWTIEHARLSGLFDAIAVSSDAEDILKAAGAAGADILVRRPPAMASDTAPKIDAIAHALETAMAQSGLRPTTFVDLDATAPLRLPEDIVGAVRLLEETGCTSVITGAPARRSPYFNLVEEDRDGHVALSKGGLGIVRRQDAPRAFDMNASIYVWDVARFRAHPAVFYPDTRLFEMPEDRSLDIDSPLDFEIVRFLMDRRHRQEGTPS